MIRKYFVKNCIVLTFVALATVKTNSTISCGLKSTHYKLMPGSAVVCLVTVASFPTSIAPGSLVFTPFLSYQNLRHMPTTKHLFDLLEEQAELALQSAIANRKLTQRLCAEIRATIDARKPKTPKPYHADRSLLKFVN